MLTRPPEFSKHAVDSGFEALLMPTPELEVLCLLVQAFGARIVSVMINLDPSDGRLLQT